MKAMRKYLPFSVLVVFVLMLSGYMFMNMTINSIAQEMIALAETPEGMEKLCEMRDKNVYEEADPLVRPTGYAYAYGYGRHDYQDGDCEVDVYLTLESARHKRWRLGYVCFSVEKSHVSEIRTYWFK